MAVDPMIARGSPGIDVTNTLAQIAQMRQRDQMLQQQGQQNALMQQRYQAGVEQEDEEDRLWESAYQSKDWAAMARIDPQHLAWSLENLVEGRVVNQISVSEPQASLARLTLEKMLEVSR